MFSKTLHSQRLAKHLHQGLVTSASVPTLCKTQAHARSHATRHPGLRTVTGMAALSVALLLTACGSFKNLLPGDQAEPIGPGATVPVVGTRRTRITSRDIMLEWSTASKDGAPYKAKKAARSSPLDRVLDEPDYTVSIKEIMANAACHSCEAKPYHQMVVNASNRHGVPTSLIHAVIQKESSYNPSATSKRRARGLMQVTPETARFVGVSNSRHLYDPQTNIYTGTAYLKYLLANHDTVDEALAAYNAGPGNVRKYKGVPPFKETKRYVRDVKELYATTSR